MRSFVRTFLPAVSAILLVAIAPSAQAQICPFAQTLNSNNPTVTVSDPARYMVFPDLARWAVVAVRPTDGRDWNMEVFDQQAPFPTCYTDLLASSSQTGIDFAVVDRRFRSQQTDFVIVQSPGNFGVFSQVEFEQAQYDLQSNHVADTAPMSANEVVLMREAQMFAGVRYFIQITPDASLTGLGFYIFSPVTSGNGWVPRSGRAFEQALVAGTGNYIEYTPTVSGVHALVITKDSSSDGGNTISIKHCPFGYNPLIDNVPDFTNLLDEWRVFTPTGQSWGVVGVRGDPGYGYNLDTAPYPRDQNGPFMACTDTVLGAQYSGLGARVVAADFSSIPLRDYTMHTSIEGQPKTNSSGWMEWENGADTVIVNGPPIVVTPPANNVFDAWTIRLALNADYNFAVTTDDAATANYKMLLFGNPNPGTEYWAGRQDALSELGTAGGYAPDHTGLYSLVVVNENGGTGAYQLSVTSPQVGVGPGGPYIAQSRIRATLPNPTFGGSRIDYELAAAGEVAVQLVDVSGRVVAAVPAGRRVAGPASVTWNGLRTDGTRPPAGIYFAMLTVDGRVVDRSKVTVLR